MITQLRSLPYREFSVAWTFSPVRNAVLDRIPGALASVLRDPGAIGPRALMGSSTPERFSAESIDRTTERLVTVRAVERVRGRATPDHPLRILISDERVTFAVSHATIDGLGMAELIAAVMGAAVGTPVRLDSRRPIRFPLLTGLRSVGMDGVRDYLRTRRTAEIIGPEVAEGVLPCQSVSIEMPIDADLLARIERLPRRGRTTPGARLASVSIAALSRVHRRDVDVPVAVPVSLLRHVGNRRVLGNFIGIDPLGTLHGSDWSPEAITARLADAAKSGRAMAGLVYAVVRAARYAAVPAPRSDAHRRVAISMQMISLPTLVPDAAWASDEWRTCAATIGPWPSSTALAPFRMGKRWGVSAWDESGDFDLDAFPEALLAEVGERESAARSPLA